MYISIFTFTTPPSFLFPSDTRHKAGNHVRTTIETGKTKYILEFFSLP